MQSHFYVNITKDKNKALKMENIQGRIFIHYTLSFFFSVAKQDIVNIIITSDYSNSPNIYLEENIYFILLLSAISRMVSEKLTSNYCYDSDRSYG